MAAQVEATRLLTWSVAIKHHRGEGCDLEAGIAKLFATEMCERAAFEGIQIHGGYGFTEDFAVERYSRDAKLLTVGEGTNRIQCLVGRKDEGLRRFRDRRFPVDSSYPGHSANLDPHHVQRLQVRNHGE
jgi:alkylation response protein AidB-like acyl-CoA dehydrogenase